jgi:ribosomal subunit interface protein
MLGWVGKAANERIDFMDILVHADGLALTPDLRAAAEEKIGRIELTAPRALRARVRIRRSTARHNSGQYVVRVLVEVPGRDLSVEQIGPEPLLALDIAADKIERRLRKRKTRRLSNRTKGSLRAREKA